MSSRRRNSKKNLGNSISDIQRRIRRMERKPIRTRLQNRVIKGSAIAPNTITPEEVSFGTAVVTSDNPADVIDTPKEGLLIVDPTTNSASVYSEAQGDYVTIQDAAAVAIAQGKSKTYVQNDEPTGGTYSLGDLWIDTNDGNKLYAYSGSAWAAKQDGAISTAQATANGKNKVYYDTAVPGSTANTAGDIWWQYASGVVVGQYVGAGGTSWTSAPIGNTVIANLDAGKITTGYIDVAGSVKITTSANASGTGGTTARIEINSTGFYAYDGSVATVSITNTGTAVFSGTVNATAGAFTGYVTAGTARFGANVNSTDDGIWINANNYWYDTGSFKVGDGTESMSYSSAGGLVVTGDINATGGTFTGYVTGGTARFGTNVDSTNDGIWINSYNYWYDTGAFKVGDGSESMSYTSAGGLVVTGEISAGTFSGSISSTATITGGSFVTTGNVGAFTGNALTITGGAISAGKVVSLSTTTALSDGVIDFDTDYITLSAGIQTEIFGAIKMSGSTTFYGSNNSIGIDTDVGGTSTKNIRNVWIRTTLISTSSSAGNIGDIWLQYA